MRWFINSTKETAGFNDNNFQAQIDAIKKRLDIMDIDAEKMDQRNYDKFHDKGIQINNILKHQGNQDERIDELEKSRNNLRLILKESFDAAFKEIDKLTKRIEDDELAMEKAKELLRTAFNTITDLDNKVKALENQSVPKQTIPDAKPKEMQIKIPKFRRMKNTYSDWKYASTYAIAHGYAKAGFNQVQIAGKLNALGHRTPKGMEFTERHVTDLMCNSYQKAKFLEGKEKKAKL